MTKEEKINYWISLSDYDIVSAEAMLNTKRYLYVGLMCHQTLEKIFKACFTKALDEAPPHIHRLVRLAELAGFYDRFSEEQKVFIDRIEPLNIKTRYPDYKQDLLNSLTPEVCNSLIEQTKTLQQWIKEMIL